jgi:DNA-binding response OmpR family regulator
MPPHYSVLWRGSDVLSRGASVSHGRKFPIGDYPPTDQEVVILRALRSRPNRGWTMEELLTELSKGRAQPMTYRTLAVHLTHLRRKGFAIKRETVYSIGGLELARQAFAKHAT